MAENSKIEWTDATWNTVAGCTPVSPGCTHCYAATMARRLEAMGQPKYAGTAERRGSVDVFTGRINLDPDSLDIPTRWRKPRRIFVNSMSDLFHDGVPFEFVDKVIAVAARCPQHTFQILTKRPARMFSYFDERQPPPENVWLGTSVENQEQADMRIPRLVKSGAAVRFLSCEPLLGAVDISPWGSDLHWVIVGGESGRGARPMHPDWVLSLRDQCESAGVPFFFKQWGEWCPFKYLPDETLETVDLDRTEYVVMEEHSVHRVGKKLAGRLLDSAEYNEFPSPSQTI